MKGSWKSEESLATAVSGWLEQQGWECFHEVCGGGGEPRADIVATQRRLVWVVECKLRLGLEVLAQASRWRRLGLAHFVSVAVPVGKRTDATWFAERTARDNGIGVIWVPSPEHVEQGEGGRAPGPQPQARQTCPRHGGALPRPAQASAPAGEEGQAVSDVSVDIAAIRAATGVHAARLRRDFLHRFEPLVVGLAHRLTYVDLELEDRIQYGWLGLAEALERCDDRGTTFVAYARWRVFAAITRGGRDHGRRVVRLPASLQWRRTKVSRAERVLSHALQRQPSTSEVAAACGLAPRQIDPVLAARVPVASLYARDGGHISLESVLSGPPADTEALADLDKVSAAVAALPPALCEVVRQRYGFEGEEQSLRAVAQRIGVSHETARAYEADALARIRAHLEGRPVSDALCACGCGRPVPPTSRRRYARGHAPARRAAA